MDRGRYAGCGDRAVSGRRRAGRSHALCDGGHAAGLLPPCGAATGTAPACRAVPSLHGTDVAVSGPWRARAAADRAAPDIVADASGASTPSGLGRGGPGSPGAGPLGALAAAAGAAWRRPSLDPVHPDRAARLSWAGAHREGLLVVAD